MSTWLPLLLMSCESPLINYHFLLPTSCVLRPASYFLLPTSYFLLPASCFLLPASYFLLPTSYFLLPTSYFLLPTSYFLLPTSTLYFYVRTAAFSSVSFHMYTSSHWDSAASYIEEVGSRK